MIGHNDWLRLHERASASISALNSHVFSGATEKLSAAAHRQLDATKLDILKLERQLARDEQRGVNASELNRRRGMLTYLHTSVRSLCSLVSCFFLLRNNALVVRRRRAFHEAVERRRRRRLNGV
jgi:hypothetical protein